LCGILDKLTRKAKPLRIIGDQDNQRLDKCSSTVFFMSHNSYYLTQHLQVMGLLLLYLKVGGNATFVRVFRLPIKCSVQYHAPVPTKAKPRNDFSVCHIITVPRLSASLEWMGNVASMRNEEDEKLVQILSLESATAGERLRCRLNDNIKTDPN
jgi:hypothetical protein